MRTLKILVCCLLWIVFGALSGTALASSSSERDDDIGQEQDQYQDQWQEQDQWQDQTQDQVQDQAQEQSMGDMVGGSQSMTFKGAEQAMSANAPTVFSSAPCYVGGSAALGVKGLNIGGGRQVLDVQCELRETARMLISAGEVELGVMLLCLTKASAMLPEGACYPHGNVKAELKAAQDRVAFLLNERVIDRAKCKESKDRIAEGCRK